MEFSKDSFEIHHITGRIYLFLFDELFDLCMHFLRYQEFYESPKFRNKKFTILEFMEWYSKTFGNGSFTYTTDWAGFNIPSKVIWQVHANHIDDYNKYDAAMMAAFNKVSSITHLFTKSKYDSFYILGACKSEFRVLEHEIAHGLYETDATFRSDITKCIKSLPSQVVSGVFDYLQKIGYAENVLEDELQAYFSTGLTDELMKYTKYTAPFQKVYKKYTKNVCFNSATAKPLQFQ